ncbi:hypothetical protein [Gordonia sp. (in: high G+C Gram-positive bacteria)]|uniref:hypothetical protein n=1 Tax=Gordonia sp. (in: high G+C Gram-positive bacteria) TaxID=84139 RepID=UPI0026172D4F|nr:hypothetical protein [Gordonia sp. (in: high G+C Gram-positive bacteria)]
MNRDIALEASLAVAVGLLIVTWAAFRSTGAPTAGAMRRGGMAVVLVYAVLAVPLLASSGLALAGLAVLVVVIALAFAAGVVALRRSIGDDGRPRPETAGERYARCAVSVGMTAVLLIAAAQTLSLLSRLDPRIIVLALTVVAGWLVVAQGLAATHRIGSTAMWFMIVPVVASLALGFYLGGPGVVADPIRLVDGVSAASAVGLAVVLVVLGWADGALRTSALLGSWSRPRVLGGALGVVILIVLGLLMLLGGAILVPSMEFFTVPANLDMLPGLAGVVLAVLTVVFTALIAHTLSAAAGAVGVTSPADAPAADDDRQPDSALALPAEWVLGAAIVAAALALIDVGAPVLLLCTALVAAAVTGAQLAGPRIGAPGVTVGIAVAVVAAIVLAATGQREIGWWTSLAIVVTAAAAFAAARLTAPAASDPETVSGQAPRTAG